MSENTFHLSAERLETFVEGLLDQGDRVVVESHLAGCSQCQAEVEELRTLFAALARMERFSPMPGFAHRVMAQVRLPDPWYARAARQLQVLVPRTSRGWAFASALFSLPLVGLGAIMVWLLSKPYVSGQGLLSFTTNQVGSRIGVFTDSLVTALVQSDVMLVFIRGVQSLVEAGATTSGGLLAAFTMMTVWSSWVLYQNLFRKPTLFRKTRGSDYATFSF